MRIESSWSFDTADRMPHDAVLASSGLIDRFVSQGKRWSKLDHFKNGASDTRKAINCVAGPRLRTTRNASDSPAGSATAPTFGEELAL